MSRNILLVIYLSWESFRCHSEIPKLIINFDLMDLIEFFSDLIVIFDILNDYTYKNIVFENAIEAKKESY